MKKIFLVIFVGVILFVVFYGNSSKPEIRSLGQLLLPKVFETKETKILFVGDMFFDRYIRQVGNSKGGDFVFSCVSDFLKDFDLVVGNLEGPITGNPSISLGTEIENPENYVFTFPPNTAKLLAKNNIKIVNLNNNHIGNFGEEGIILTKRYLGEAGIKYFDNKTIYRTKIGGIDMSFISYNEFSGESAEKVAQKIKEEKEKERMVFVYAHWGDEYSEVPNRVAKTAELFAKSGADFIVGSHPHIILPSQSFDFAQDRKTTVYYSLGNFIFDQYWNKEVSTGLVLELNIKDKNITATEHYVSLNKNGQTCLVN